MDAAALRVDLAQLLAKPMSFDADDCILRRIEAFLRSPKDSGRDVELGELIFPLLEGSLAEIRQQSTRSRASAQKLDRSLQFLSLGVARVHADELPVLLKYHVTCRLKHRGIALKRSEKSTTYVKSSV